MKIASESQIGTLLADLQNALGNQIHIERTEKNKKTILSLGFTNKNIKDVVSKLTLEDYSEGPFPGKQTSNMLWVFGKEITNKQIYIKIEIGKLSFTGEEKRTA